MARNLLQETNHATTFAGDERFLVAVDPAGTPADGYTEFDDIRNALIPFDGIMLNGKISPSVASNNLTLALKTMGGSDPSASEPVLVRIGSAIYKITGALSITVNAGTNWFNSGSSELATKEVDYFAYLGYNATDGVVIGISRLPGARIYSDFSTTNTSERYAAISTITTAAATDNYAVIGRFAATLSAGAGYTWTVPTYTGVNLIQSPIRETRWLNYTPTPSSSGLTWTSVTFGLARYKLSQDRAMVEVFATGTAGGSAYNLVFLTAPIDATQAAAFPTGHGYVTSGGATMAAIVNISGGTPDIIAVAKYDRSNYATSGTLATNTTVTYEI